MLCENDNLGAYLLETSLWVCNRVLANPSLV